MSSTTQRLGQLTGLTISLLFLFTAFTPLPNVLAGRLIVSSRIEAAEAIVVLGAGIINSRTPSPASLGRTIHAVQLYRQRLAPTIIFSGGSAGQAAAESAVMASLAVELGVPTYAIWAEAESNDTWTEATEVARLAQPRGIKRILLVTDLFHMRRASAAFERVGFQVLPAAWETAAMGAYKPEDRLMLMRQVGLEAFARLYYWIRSQL